MNASYALSAWFFSRAIALIYFIAFASLAVQIRGLWGIEGILPISRFLEAVRMQADINRYWQLPSLFWLGSSDQVLILFVWLGIICATAAFLGIAQGWMFLACFVLYLSFTTAGQDFMSFQWDSLLLEVGFLTLFIVPWALKLDFFSTYEPHWSLRFMFYIVLFKLMFLSGLVKILSQDPSWRDLSALSYHYWTQPLPNPAAPFVHALPLGFHRLGTAVTFLIELIVPFAIFWPRFRLFAAFSFISLSFLILFTGNFTFFNWLTIALCFWLIPDAWWESLSDLLPFKLQENPAELFAHPFPSFIVAFLALVSIYWCIRFWLPDSVNSRLSAIIQTVQAFHISNPYGLFAIMTKSRPEIIFEGSRDGLEWKEYDLIYKPGNLYHTPPVVAPHQPRLDWQLWFAALGSFRENPWVQDLMVRMLENSPEVMSFFSVNPFMDRPPQYLRARLYAYEFATPGEIWSEGKWWRRELLGEYSPVFKRQ